MSTSANPVLAYAEAPSVGAPPLAAIRPGDFAPAFAAASVAQAAAVDAIRNDPTEPDFSNTFEALERAGGAVRQVQALLGVFTSTRSDAEIRAVQRALAPRFAAARDRIFHDAALFDRLERAAVAFNPADLTPEQARLVDVTLERFRRQGAGLEPEAKARLAEVNARLADLQAEFSQRVLHDEETGGLLLSEARDLEGLPETLVRSARAAAAARGHGAGWLIANTRSAVEPFLTHAERRDLREAAYAMWTGRGAQSEGAATWPLVAEILALRREKAKLLGHETFAHWVAAGQMSGSPDAARALLERVWTPAVRRLSEEVDQIRALPELAGANLEIEPWDFRFYAERVRRTRYALSDAELKPHLQLDRLLEGLFWIAGELFGLRFERTDAAPTVHPDVEVYRVARPGAEDGLWYFDLLARPGKTSGAWMNEYRTQHRLGGQAPIVSNNANFIPGGDGAPTLLSWSDATTLFHEFGHGLHGLLSDVTYPSLAGTSVVRDFVETPSQLMEAWLETPEFLERYARHAESGAPMSADLLRRVEQASTFRQGFDTVEYLVSARLDLDAHAADPQAAASPAFEREVLRRLGVPRAGAPRHRLPHFTHLFSSEGYAAGYYNYMWAEVLSADAAEAFGEAPGGYYDRTLAARLRDEILSVGNAVAPQAAFRRFRGRDPDPEALLRARGLA